MNIVLARETQNLLMDTIKHGVVSEKSLKQICEILQNDIKTEIDCVKNCNRNGVVEIKLVKEWVDNES